MCKRTLCLKVCGRSLTVTFVWMWPRISYTEAIDILNRSSHNFVFPTTVSDTLGSQTIFTDVLICSANFKFNQHEANRVLKKPKGFQTLIPLLTNVAVSVLIFFLLFADSHSIFLFLEEVKVSPWILLRPLGYLNTLY